MKRLSRHLSRRIAWRTALCALLGFSLLVPSAGVLAQAGHAADTEKMNDQAVNNARKAWTAVNTREKARAFFGVNSPDDSLVFLNLIGTNWQVPSSDAKDQEFEENELKQLEQLGKDKRFRVRVYRNQFAQYVDPEPYAVRSLTLTGGYYLDDSAIKEIMEEQTDGADKGLLSLNPAVAGFRAVTGVLGSTDEHSLWAFTADHNPHVQMILTCTPGGGVPGLSSSDKEGHSRFVYLPEADDIHGAKEAVDGEGEDAGDVDALDKKYKISNVNRTLRGEGHAVVPQSWSNTTMAKWLCDRSGSKEKFEEWCPEKLGQKNCIFDAEGFLNINPIAWAIGQIRKMVGALVGMVADVLSELANIGSLANTQAINESWKTMRDLVNLIFILILIVIAFSTMLRIDTQKYSARALLPRLVFAVLAVNFSLMMLTLLVDAATILGRPFAGSLGKVLEENPAANVDSFGSFVTSYYQEMIMLLGAIVIALVLIVLALFFLIRVLMIWLLGAFAPFVFLFMVLPFTRSLSTAWVKQAVKWTFMAPISFMILWVGEKFLTATDRFDDSLLGMLLFIGTVVAAVMIPLELGGKVMGRALQGSKMAGKLGAKGGLKAGMAAAGQVGGGDGGPTLADRARASAYGLGLAKPENAPPGSRKAMRQERALEHLQQQTAEGRGIGALTGASAGQRTRARQRMLHTAQQEQAQVSPYGKQRIAWGHSAMTGGAGHIDGNGNVWGLSTDGTRMINFGQFQNGEEEFARSRIASEAAFADLAQGNQVAPALNEEFAASGLPQLNAHNPALASIDRGGQYRPEVAVSRAANTTRSDLKSQQNEFWEHANQALAAERSGQPLSPYHRTVLAAARAYDAQSLAYASTTGTRDSFDHSETRDAVHAFAQSGGFSDARDAVVRDSYNGDANAAETALRTHGVI